MHCALKKVLSFGEWSLYDRSKAKRNHRDRAKRGPKEENPPRTLKKVLNLEERSLYDRSKAKTKPPGPRKTALETHNAFQTR